MSRARGGTGTQERSSSKGFSPQEERHRWLLQQRQRGKQREIKLSAYPAMSAAGSGSATSSTLKRTAEVTHAPVSPGAGHHRLATRSRSEEDSDVQPLRLGG